LKSASRIAIQAQLARRAPARCSVSVLFAKLRLCRSPRSTR
jgi:hypothetical protein